jgi:hypothetical protein
MSDRISLVIRQLFRYVLLFGVVCFFFVRQLYVNLLGIDRAITSAVFVAIMSVAGIFLLLERAKRLSPSFYVIDGILAMQFMLAGVMVAFYWLAGRINSSQATYSIYYNCFAPLLLYIGFYLRKKNQGQIESWLVAASLVFVFMMIAAVLQVFGIDWWLFRNEKWFFMPTFFGIQRPTAGYGTQIDFGMFCFIFFVCSFYTYFETKSVRSALIAFLSFAGTVLAFSRVFIFAAVVVFVFQFLRPSVIASLKRKGATLATLVLSTALIVTVFQQLNIIAMFKAEDAITQESNEARMLYFQSAPKWVLEDYPYVGSGPGTQNGPNIETKTVTDFLWLALLIEFGFAVGIIIVLLKIAVLLIVIRNYLRSQYRPALATAAFVLSISFLLVSFVDSAFAHPVTISIFYLIAGSFLYSCYSRSTSSVCVQPVLA